MRRDCKIIITPDLLMPNAILRQLYDRRSKRSLKSHATCCMYAFELERVSLSSSPARMEPIKWQWQLELTRAFNRNRVASEGNKGITWDCNIASGGRRIEVHWVYIFETKKMVVVCRTINYLPSTVNIPPFFKNFDYLQPRTYKFSFFLKKKLSYIRRASKQVQYKIKIT